MTIQLKPYTQAEVEAITPWFDDPTTHQWLGGREWLQNELRQVNTPAGAEFRGARIVARYAYVAYDGELPIGFINAEVTDKYVEYGGMVDGKPIYLNSKAVPAASISFVVAPAERQKGYGKAIIAALMDSPDLRDVRIFVAGVEPENLGSIRTLEAAGFTSNRQPDFENMYYFLLRR